MSEWFKDGFFWRHPKSGDAGDLIFNTLARIVDQEDRSEWAEYSLIECMDLLIIGKRWPDRFNYIPTERSQTKMTRDPYKVFYCAALMLNHSEYIELVMMPWYCYNPAAWRWRRKLIKQRSKPWWRWRLDHYEYLALAIKTSDDPNIIANKEDKL